MRRDEILEVVEVKPLTVADVDDERAHEAPAEPPTRPQPVRA
jgi:hypothetical protein